MSAPKEVPVISKRCIARDRVGQPPARAAWLGACLAGGIVMALWGCALGGPEQIDARNSYPSARVVSRETHHHLSRLLVFTERYWDPNIGDPDAGTKHAFTGYTVYDERGKKIEYVSQRDQEPTELSLTPGRYLILLERPEGHAPLFWVKVELGRIIEAHVDQLPPATP